MCADVDLRTTVYLLFDETALYNVVFNLCYGVSPDCRRTLIYIVYSWSLLSGLGAAALIRA